MAPLEDGDCAVVALQKLTDYCLAADHEDGKHKARVFAAALGLGRADAAWLRERLLDAAASRRAVVVSKTRFGTLYLLDFPWSTEKSTAIEGSGWIVRHAEEFPRLTTCYVRKRVT